MDYAGLHADLCRMADRALAMFTKAALDGRETSEAEAKELGKFLLFSRECRAFSEEFIKDGLHPTKVWLSLTA
jgi:hypothetical protein